jgi:nucleotide-binding universal stress UspA family protein
MNEQERGLSIRNILVALDASVHSAAAVQAAVALAARLRAEVTGLFVEDINLIRMSELPFARELNLFTSTLQRIERGQIERQLRAQAHRMRRMLASYAEKAGVSWQFRIVRGSVAPQVMTAASEADLVIMGKLGRSLHRHMGSTAQFIVSRGQGLMLVLQHGYRLDVPVTVFHDGTPLAEKALEASIHLIKIKDGQLTVFILAPQKESAQEIQSAAMERLKSHELASNFRLVIQPTLAKIKHLIRLEGGGPVVIPCDSGDFQGEELCRLVYEIPNPILLVR